MKKNNLGLHKPSAFIAVNKKRLKQFGDIVYLNDKQEFQIELFNPTQNKVLSKIEINGLSIGSGIILRPGERVFLERYLDEAKKFLFETYVVNGNNEEVKNAIGNNGDITIKFFDEVSLSPKPFQYNQPIWANSANKFWDSRVNTTINPYEVTFTTSSQPIGTTVTNTAFFSNNTLSFEKDIVFPIKSLKSKKRDIETGRVEKGSKSDQSFTYDNSSFNSFPSHTNWWKIKPVSQQILVKEDLKVFCTGCGSKRKKDSHQFCPKCGTKF